MQIRLSIALILILGIVLLPTSLTADIIQAEESPSVILACPACPCAGLERPGNLVQNPWILESSAIRLRQLADGGGRLPRMTKDCNPQINLSLPLNVSSNWTSAPADTPGISWQTGDQVTKFAIKDGKFISTSPDDTWFIYGWFGSIEAITKPYNIKYPQWGNKHNGIDFAGRLGLDIISVSNGVVAFTGNKIGKTVTVDIGNNYVITYGHLLDISVKAGDAVQADDLIGHLGNSGTINPHLHFQVDKIEKDHKIAVNPLTLMDIDWDNTIIPNADANRFYAGPANPKLQPNFIW